MLDYFKTTEILLPSFYLTAFLFWQILNMSKEAHRYANTLNEQPLIKKRIKRTINYVTLFQVIGALVATLLMRLTQELTDYTFVQLLVFAVLLGLAEVISLTVGNKIMIKTLNKIQVDSEKNV